MVSQRNSLPRSADDHTITYLFCRANYRSIPYLFSPVSVVVSPSFVVMAPPSLHSRGGVLAAELLQRGVQVIALWTKESNVRHHVPRCGFAFERSVRSSGGTGGVVGM